jgi:hypothetical protein
MARYSRKPVDLMTLLQQNPVYQGQQQADIVRQLNTELMQILQLEKLTFCKVNRVQAGRVQIMCSSASWATRLKMQNADILTKFRQNVLPECMGIDIEVNPNLDLRYQTQEAASAAQPQARQISEQAASYLLASAENADPLLAEKLRKLAALAQQRKKAE